MAHKWTEEEMTMLKEYIPGHHHSEICDEVQKVFGWRPSKTQVAGFIKNHKVRTGFTGRFESGNVPPNKGRKVTGETYDKVARTMFKEGHQPTNTDPIGTEKMLSDGYIWVKLDNQPKAKKQVNWKQKHHIVWEKANGPIPEGHLVIFLDGDRENCSLDNLAAVTRSENVRLNQYGYRTKDGKVTRIGLDMVKILNKLKEKDRG